MQALIYIKLMIEIKKDIPVVLGKIKASNQNIEWVQLAFGDWDAVAYVNAEDHADLLSISIAINLLEKVASTSTQILASV